MNFYTQTLLQLVLALGAAMVIGNVMAIVRRGRDRKVARESLKSNPRTSRHQNEVLVKNQIKQGKATLAVAPLGRSIVFIIIGLVVSIWALASLVS